MIADVTPTARELEVLKVLWRRGRATVREIYGELKPRDGELAYTTALSLVQIMEKKRLVAHESAGKAYAYYAKVRRDSVFRKLAGASWTRCSSGCPAPPAVSKLPVGSNTTVRE